MRQTGMRLPPSFEESGGVRGLRCIGMDHRGNFAPLRMGGPGRKLTFAPKAEGEMRGGASPSGKPDTHLS